MPGKKRIPIGIEKAPDSPTAIGIGGVGQEVIVTFYWVPPEDNEKLYVLSRTALDTKTAKDLADGILKALKKSPKESSASKTT